MPDPRVTIEPAMSGHFQLDAWDALDDGARLALGDYLIERLQAHGWDVAEPLALRKFGPPGEERSVLQWREPTSGMTFSLVPGGTFRPGLDEGQIERVEAICRDQIEAHWRDREDDLGLVMEILRPGFNQLFDTDRPCDLRRKGPGHVGPMLMATKLVRPDLPGIGAVTELPPWFDDPEHRDVVPFLWPQVGPVLDHYGWALPTSSESEWATRGGLDSLFYWGDELPLFATESHGDPEDGVHDADREAWLASFASIMILDYSPYPMRSWPHLNRFGLAAMVAQATWCEPARDPSDPAPLVVRGGAANCWPWEAGIEWMLLLSAAESRRTDGDSHARACAIRPVVRLTIDELS